MILITGHRIRCNRSKGFTLFELIMVMLIIASVAAVAIPSLNLFSSSRTLSNTAAQIVALTDYARSQAVAEGREYLLEMDLENRSFQLVAWDKGAFRSQKKESEREFLIPDGIEIELLIPFERFEETEVPGLILSGYVSSFLSDSSERIKIFFYPDGRAGSGSLRLVDRRGYFLDIESQSPTGRFSIKEREG